MRTVEVPSGEVLTAGEAFDLPVADVIVPVTYSCNLERDGVRLSSLSRAAVDAALLLWVDRPDSRIAISGEHSFTGHESTAELMRDRLVDSGCPEARVAVMNTDPDSNLVHTAKQMRALADHMRGSGERTLLVPMDYHAGRVLTHAAAFGLVSANAVTVQDVLKHRGAYEQYPELEHLADFRRREAPIRWLSRLDPRGRVLDVLARIQGPRLHDVVATEEGFDVVLGTARERERQLALAQ